MWLALQSGGERSDSGLRRILILGLASLAISVATILAILHYTGNRTLLGDVLRIGLGTMGFALTMVVVSWLVDGLRLLVLARAMGGSISYLESVRISVAGAFMSGVTPSDTGGEPLKVYYLHEDGMSIGQATATITLIALLHATTRFLLWLVMPLAALLLGLTWEFTPVVKAALTLGLSLYLVFMSLLVASTLWPNTIVALAVRVFNTSLAKRFASPGLLRKTEATIRRVADDFRSGMVRLSRKGAQVGLALALSILYWIVVVSVPVFLVRRMGSQAPSLQIFMLSMTVYLVMAYVPTPGASGGAEAGSALFFAPFLPARVLATFVVAWRLATYYFTLLVGGALVVVDMLSRTLHKTKLQSP